MSARGLDMTNLMVLTVLTCIKCAMKAKLDETSLNAMRATRFARGSLLNERIFYNKRQMVHISICRNTFG